MLLTVAATSQKVEQLRKIFAHMRYFTYCATFDNMVDTAEKYAISDLVLEAEKVTEHLVEDVAKIKMLYPEIHLFLLSDDKEHSLCVTRQLPLDISSNEVLFQILYYGKPTPNSVIDFHENLLVKGMLFNTYVHEIRIYGWIIKFSANDAFLLRYLAEIYPRRASKGELLSLCFEYGKKASFSALNARISRINKRAVASLPPLSRPVVTYKAKEGGYQIDF